MKRQTKAQKDAAAKQQLHTIIHAVYSGAMGTVWSEDDFATAEILSRAIPAIEGIFAGTWEKAFSSPHVLGYWDRPETLADWLYKQGIRA